MRSFLPGRGGSGTLLSLAAIVGVGMFSMRLARQQASPTPFELFQRLLPVIRHPRCPGRPAFYQHQHGRPLSGRDHIECTGDATLLDHGFDFVNPSRSNTFFDWIL